jgi:hypothetical protein
MKSYKAVVQTIFNKGQYDLTSKEGCGRFTRQVAYELHKLDAGFGELLKSSGRTHVIDRLGRRVAVDAVLYKPTGQSVDIVGSSASPKAKPAWTEDKPRYKDSDWAEPAGLGNEPVPVPEPEPQPQPSPDLSKRIEALEVSLSVHRSVHSELRGKDAFLEAHINELNLKLINDLNVALAAIEALEDRINKLENQKLTLRAVGTTGRVFGHAHPVEIELVEIK